MFFSKFKALVLIFFLSSCSKVQAQVLSEEAVRSWEFFLKSPSSIETPVYPEEDDRDNALSAEDQEYLKAESEHRARLKESQDFWAENWEELLVLQSFDQTEFYLNLKKSKDIASLGYLFLSVFSFEELGHDFLRDHCNPELQNPYALGSLSFSDRLSAARSLYQLIKEKDVRSFPVDQFLRMLKKASLNTVNLSEPISVTLLRKKSFVLFAQSLLEDLEFSKKNLAVLRVLPQPLYTFDFLKKLSEKHWDSIHPRILLSNYLRLNQEEDLYRGVRHLLNLQNEHPLEDFFFPDLLQVLYEAFSSNGESSVEIRSLYEEIEKNCSRSDSEMAAYLGFLLKKSSGPKNKEWVFRKIVEKSKEYFFSLEASKFTYLSVLRVLNAHPDVFDHAFKSQVIEKIVKLRDPDKRVKSAFMNVELLGIVFQSTKAFEKEAGSEDSIVSYVFTNLSLRRDDYYRVYQYATLAKREIYLENEGFEKQDIIFQSIYYALSQTYNAESLLKALNVYVETDLNISGLEKVFSEVENLVEPEDLKFRQLLVDLIRKYPREMNSFDLSRYSLSLEEEYSVLKNKKISDVPEKVLVALELALLLEPSQDFLMGDFWKEFENKVFEDLNKTSLRCQTVKDSSGCNSGVYDRWLSGDKPRIQRVLETLGELDNPIARDTLERFKQNTDYRVLIDRSF